MPGYRDAGAPPTQTIDLDMILSPKPTALWRSPERLYLDSKGGVVPHGHPDAQVLLVAEGGEIPLDRAQALGLAGGDAPEKPADAPERDLPALAAAAGFDLVPKGEHDEALREIERLKALAPAAFEIPGLPHQAVEALKAAGAWSADALKAKTDEELLALAGVGETSVAKIRAALSEA